jgi:hypothetical protein
VGIGATVVVAVMVGITGSVCFILLSTVRCRDNREALLGGEAKLVLYSRKVYELV